MKNGWWKLQIFGVEELNDIDREHIAKLITEGYIEGQIIQEDEPEKKLEDVFDKVIMECRDIWSKWALDERDSGYSVVELCEKALGRKLTKDEMKDKNLLALIKWSDEVSGVGGNLAYQYRAAQSREEIGKYEDKWNEAKESEPELDL